VAGLTDSIKLLEKYLGIATEKTAISVSSITNRQKLSASGKSAKTLVAVPANASLAAVKKNPIAAMGIDTATQIITKTSQGLLRTAINKVNLKPIQNAVGGFFQMLAMATTFGTEIAMELARNTARNLIKALAEKDLIIDQLLEQITLLHNMVMVLLNSNPFLDAYLRKALAAYYLIQQATGKFANVVKVLERNARYQKGQFDSGIKNLESARDLLLPPDSANISSFADVTKLVSSSIGRQSNENALTAALAIPGITLRIGQLMLKYISATINVNAYISTYVNALDDFISSYTRNTTLDKATIDHINAGNSQLYTLLDDMAVLLFPDDETINDPFYGPNVTTAGSVWSIRLVSILEWLRLNPSKGSETLDLTSQAVDAYTKSLQLISNMNDMPYTGGELKVEAGLENSLETSIVISKMLLLANTILAKSVTNAPVSQEFRKVLDHLKQAKLLDAKIRNAITPFINTGFNTFGPAKQLVGSLLNTANSLGLDRAVGLIAGGNIKDIFSLTPQNATHSAAAVTGMNSIIARLKSDPNTPETNVAKTEEIRDELKREQTTKEIESSRASAASADAQISKADANLARKKKLITQAKQIALQSDPTSSTEETKSINKIVKSIPGFTDNNTKYPG